MSRGCSEVVVERDTVTRRICAYLHACGVEDPERQGNISRWVWEQLEARTPYRVDAVGGVPFRGVQPLIDEALADEAGLTPYDRGRGRRGCQPRLLRGEPQARPALKSPLTWNGPTPVPVKMHAQDLSAFPSLRRIGLFFPRPATSWSWVTMGGLAFIIVALW